MTPSIDLSSPARLPTNLRAETTFKVNTRQTRAEISANDQYVLRPAPPPLGGGAVVQIDTPDSVVGSHLSRRPVTGPLEPPTRDSASSFIIPVWRCTAWGLPSRLRHRSRWCALTAPFHPYPSEDGRSVFCGALPSGFPA